MQSDREFGHSVLDQSLFDMFEADDVDGPDKEEYNRAVLAYEHGDIEEATRLFQKVTQDNPKAVAARCNWGVCLAQSGEIESGLNQLRLAAKEDPNSVLVHANTGVICWMTGDLKGAEESLAALSARLWAAEPGESAGLRGRA